MVKCSNCSEAASYTNADPGANPINYCANCLPSWLQKRAQAGEFPLAKPQSASVPVEEKKEDKSSKKKTAPVEEVVEAPVVEDTTIEALTDESN